MRSLTGIQMAANRRTSRRRQRGAVGSELVILLAMALVMVAALPAAAASRADLRVELPSLIEAREGGFYLGEYAVLDGEPDIVDAASMAWVAYDGAAVSMKDVVAALGASGLAGKSAAIIMPDTVNVVPESRVAAELRSMTAWKWRIGVEGISEGQLDEHASYMLPPRVQPGSRSVSIKLMDEDGGKVNKQLKLRWYQPVVYSVKALQRGDRIDISDLRTRIEPIGMIGTRAWSPEQLTNAKLRQSVGVGRAISEGDVDHADLVRPGSSVTLVAKVNGLGIEAPGMAMQRGGIGDVIKVRNLSSRKILLGRIIEGGRVIIGL
jgi:flagella basal body P-ring formation protein FlgA